MKITLEPKELERDPSLFDWALRTARKPGDQIVVLPGATAITRGSWAFPEFDWIGLAAGVSLILTGSILQLSAVADRVTGGADRPSKDLNLLWIGDGASIKGGVLDANFKAHPGWSCGGVRAFGRCTLEKLTIMGLSGSRGLQESFAFSAQGATGGTIISEVTVEKCKVDDADSYVSGIYVGATEDNGEKSTVKNCNVHLGPRGQFAYSSTFSTLFINCYGEAMRFWYTDTGDGIAVIEECSGDASYSVIGSVSTEKTHTRSVVVELSNFVQLGKEARWVEWWNKGGVQLGGVMIRACTFNGFTHRAAIVGQTGAVVLIDTQWNPVDGGVMEYPKDSIMSGSFAPIVTP